MDKNTRSARRSQMASIVAPENFGFQGAWISCAQTMSGAKLRNSNEGYVLKVTRGGSYIGK
jgi:hypothetical protein